MVCDIYCLRQYFNCCFNDVQFDIIEYLAKTIQNTPTEHMHGEHMHMRDEV